MGFWGQYGGNTSEVSVFNKFVENHELLEDSYVQAHFLHLDQVTTNAAATPANAEGGAAGAQAECPLCRCDISKGDASKIYSLTERCCVCLDKTTNMYFKECGHACVCDECLVNL